ncbi:hypothetical protein VN97_g12192 [Penicillium thymicola]|uniref:RRM domain-containing protein n=1 Tax=Penicillium thymicola TaxID=293382 RepID=A0AAI9T6R2_PENTH|nr:hypothetical protein VN97_g12192 [Penicillium thymicola]
MATTSRMDLRCCFRIHPVLNQARISTKSATVILQVESLNCSPPEGVDDESPWGPKVQKKYDEFLHDERINVAEGLWDLFPMGSRLFVGNLPTERITKRDMFHIFHKYGKLAQISIKQAYGFIQFLEASSCHAAFGVEQGAIVRGRKIRLDLLGLLQRLPGHPRRVVRCHRSSPELPRYLPLGSLEIYTTNPMSQVHRRPVIFLMSPFIAGAMIVVYRDHGPLGFSGLDTSTGRVIEPLEGLSDEDVLAPHVLLGLSVLEIDALAVWALERFVLTKAKQICPSLVESLVMYRMCSSSCWKSSIEILFFMSKMSSATVVRVDVLVLGPGISLGAALHRQFIEGVLAVVRLSRPNQISRKIPLQLFDRTAGLDNVRFLDYPDLEPNMSAELPSHQAQAMQRGAAPVAPNLAFGIPAMSPMPILQPNLHALSNSRNLANLIYSLDGPSFSYLLSAIQRTPYSQPLSATQSPFFSSNPPPPADLAGLLANANRRQLMPSWHPLFVQGVIYYGITIVRNTAPESPQPHSAP